MKYPSLLFTLLSCSILSATPITYVAVGTFTGKGITSSESSTFTKHFIEKYNSSAKHKAVNYSSLKKLGLERLDIVSELSYALALGRLLDAQYVLLGSITHENKQSTCTIKITSTKEMKTIQEITKTQKGKPKKLLTLLAPQVSRIVDPVVVEKKRKPVPVVAKADKTVEGKVSKTKVAVKTKSLKKEIPKITKKKTKSRKKKSGRAKRKTKSDSLQIVKKPPKVDSAVLTPSPGDTTKKIVWVTSPADYDVKNTQPDSSTVPGKMTKNEVDTIVTVPLETADNKDPEEKVDEDSLKSAPLEHVKKVPAEPSDQKLIKTTTKAPKKVTIKKERNRKSTRAAKRKKEEKAKTASVDKKKEEKRPEAVSMDKKKRGKEPKVASIEKKKKEKEPQATSIDKKEEEKEQKTASVDKKKSKKKEVVKKDIGKEKKRVKSKDENKKEKSGKKSGVIAAVSTGIGIAVAVPVFIYLSTQNDETGPPEAFSLTLEW